MSPAMAELRKRSGSVDDDDRIVAFLYGLLRDHVPAGVVEKVMREHVEVGDRTSVYCNGWLAKYAQDVAARLRENIDSNSMTVRILPVINIPLIVGDAVISAHEVPEPEKYEVSIFMDPNENLCQIDSARNVNRLTPEEAVAAMWRVILSLKGLSVAPGDPNGP